MPALERFRDQTVADAITVDELLQARAQSLTRGVARPLSDTEREAWLAPWHAEDRVRSWTAMAGAADASYTLELLDRLRDPALPTLLVWVEQGEFQPGDYAERYARKILGARLVPIPALATSRPLMMLALSALPSSHSSCRALQDPRPADERQSRLRWRRRSSTRARPRLDAASHRWERGQEQKSAALRLEDRVQGRRQPSRPEGRGAWL